MVGSATVDEQSLQGRPLQRQLGGVVTYAGAALAQQGLAPLAVCNLGGAWAATARDRLRQLGIAVEADTTPVMTCFRNTVLADGERLQELVSLARPIDRTLIARALDGLGHPPVHLGPLHGTDIDLDALELLAQRASYVTLDIQGLVRASRRGPVTIERSPYLSSYLRFARVVKASDAELQDLCEFEGCEFSELLRRYDIEELVVTEGSRGGYVVNHLGDRWPYAAVPVPHVVDTTGAGDVFFAVYLAERLHRGRSTSDAAANAAKSAARRVAGLLIDYHVLELNEIS